MDQPGDAYRSERQDAVSGPGPRETEPRRFHFMITCERCREFRHTLQAMRWHLKGCPGGRSVTSRAAIAASRPVPGQKCVRISTGLVWSRRIRTSPDLPWARHRSGCSPRRSPLLCRLRFLGMLTPLGCMTSPLRGCMKHRVPHLGGKLRSAGGSSARQQVSHPRRWQHPVSSVTLRRARRPRRASP